MDVSGGSKTEAGRAPKGAGEASTELMLGHALEMMGKMPALASRAAVYALLAESMSHSERSASSSAQARFGDVLDLFAALLAALKSGDEAHGVSPGAAAMLEEHVWSDARISGAVDQFVASAFFLRAQLAGPATVDHVEARELGELAAGPVADAFVRAIGVVRRLFDESAAKSKQNAVAASDLTVRTLEKLDDLTLRIQLISVNASVEAARAGQAGAGFGVIAQEINMLSVGAQTAVNEIRSGFAQLH